MIRNAMIILGGWALANFAVSGTLLKRTSGETRFFHQMNIFWNTVNFCIAAAALAWLFRRGPVAGGRELLSAYRTFTRVLLINAGLDILYISGGIVMRRFGKRGGERGPRLAGYGVSLIVQGGFLFAFDVITAGMLMKSSIIL